MLASAKRIVWVLFLSCGFLLVNAVFIINSDDNTNNFYHRVHQQFSAYLNTIAYYFKQQPEQTTVSALHYHSK